MKSLILNRLSRRFNILGQSERARSLLSESLRVIAEIRDESHRVSSLANLADTFEALKFELGEADKDVLRAMIRRSAW